MLMLRTTRSCPSHFGSRHSGPGRFGGAPARQRGVVLLITLIVLVAMTLAAISLVRSVDTTNVIAGNLAFRQTATLSGDIGTEAAIAWIEAHNTGNTLFSRQPGFGYFAKHQDPLSNQSWDDWWTQVVIPNGFFTLAPDTAGNTVSYRIDRMCELEEDPNTPAPPANCQISTIKVSTGSSQTSQSQGLTTAKQIIYRITSRISGPRNSVTYVQATIAL